MERIVVKIGTSSLINKDGGLDEIRIKDIARQVSLVQAMGTKVAIVTSGAIASGKIILGTNNGNEAREQVLAAVGQRPLLNAWGEAFDQYGLKTGLFLFSEDDLDKPRLPLLDALMADIVPIINANDTVSIDEIRKLAISADNDRLASFVGRFLVGASKLILLTETEGVLDRGGNKIDLIGSSEDLDRVTDFGKTSVGTGGMGSKILEARRFLTDGGKCAYIAGAREKDVISKIMGGEQAGTSVTLPLQGILL